MDKEKIKEIKTLLSSPKKIVIVTHKNPDGDAMGSCLAMWNYLQNTGHICRVITSDEYPNFLHWLPGNRHVKILEKHHVESDIKECDIIFCLDFNHLNRTGGLQSSISNSKAIKIMIDHHEEPDNFAEYTYSNPNICATAQMVYHFIEKMGDAEKIDKNIATCIYTGIMTDTGSFKFNKTTSTTHKIVSNLIEKGAKNNLIHRLVYDQNSLNRLKLLGVTINHINIIDKLPVGYTYLSWNDLKEYRFKKGDTEGFVNYILSIKDISFAAIFIEDKENNIIKISLRSKGNIFVNHFAQKHFQGGGHLNAAGGKSEKNLKDTINDFKTFIEKEKNVLF